MTIDSHSMLITDPCQDIYINLVFLLTGQIIPFAFCNYGD